MDELIKNLSLLAKAAAMYLDAKRVEAEIASKFTDACTADVTKRILQDVKAVEASQPADVTPPVEKPKAEAKKALEKTKAEPKAVEPPAEPTPAPVQVQLSYETDIAPVLREVATRNREGALAVLGKYGAASGKNIKPEVYELFLADLKNV